MHVPVNPDPTVYGVALLLTVVSGFLSGAIPVSQVLRTNPYEVVKSGSIGTVRRRITARDVLLAVQIALCAVLVTSSMVAVRGLARALHSNFGFEPQNALLVSADLHIAGYSGYRVPLMQKRMIDAVAPIPGVQSVGLTDALLLNDSNGSDVFTNRTTDLRPSNAAANAYLYHISQLLGILASRVLAFIVYQATPRDPLVLAGAVLAMSLLGLLATWIPAQRALSIDPVILLREE